MEWIKVGISFITVYLIGSIPFAYILTQWKRGLNIWEVGEGNVGARNVWHVVGPFWGTLTALLDASKGASAMLIATRNPEVNPYLFGLLAVIGHQFPLFLRGRGGKGAATFMGFLLTLHPVQVILSLLLYLTIFVITRNFHIAISIAMSSIPLLFYPITGIPMKEGLYTVLLMSVLGIKRVIDHRHMVEVKRRDTFWTS